MFATEDHCTNFKTEVEAISQAATNVAEAQKQCDHVFIFTDAESFLEALSNA